MKLPALFTTFLIASLCLTSRGEDLRHLLEPIPGFVGPELQGRTREIDPDHHVYGLGFGLSREDVVRQLGAPVGYMNFTAIDEGLFFGRSHMLLFTNGKLSGVKIHPHLFDQDLSTPIPMHAFFDKADWVIAPGLRQHMSFSAIAELIPQLANRTPDFRVSYTTERSMVKLRFSSSEREGSRQYFLYGITIEPKPR